MHVVPGIAAVERLSMVPRAAARALTLAALGVLGVLAGCERHDGAASAAPRTVCITGYNEYTRKLHEFWLDNERKSGCFGNPSAREAGEAFGGGGGSACGCKVTPGQTVKLAWVFAQPLDEIQRGVQAEHKTIDVAIPQPESSTSRYLRVYFRKNGTAELQWVDDMNAPELPTTVEQ
ncbi:putative lipoprotein [Burkholderia lata]|uniref:hypothetical protein n=1 Tax=Burkholderia lata (strain ATCC 17760 / DSM 23089 / LMG 22485 / NCIMB 9086 / R18194 / 383) TaxID=482957 RepID=UPI001452D2E5|nr:hypothetical protein [Burkholderia lata]VWC98226.1 putative lipoprotein [Burkholderia lata]